MKAESKLNRKIINREKRLNILTIHKLLKGKEIGNKIEELNDDNYNIDDHHVPVIDIRNM